MDIGGALAEARSEAGLTITQVSERTRIRETIIRDIERDDYSALSGGSTRGGGQPAPQQHHRVGATAERASGSAAAAGRRAGAIKLAVVGPLTVASAAAFGPGGTGTGDDTQGARELPDSGSLPADLVH
jgi:hypothetical protein